MLAADLTAIGLRGLAYAAALQAAGVCVFRWLCGGCLERSAPGIAKAGVYAAWAAIVLTLAHAVVEPARLTGELAGMLDTALHAMLLSSDAGTAVAVRLFGLLLILAGALNTGRTAAAAAFLGASLTVASFAFMGHTAANPQRWLLAPLLIVHLFAVAFWFGGLVPLAMAARRETAAVGGQVIERFSRIAFRLVPLILVAGVAMAALLLSGVAALTSPYGISLLAKLAGFALLMGLAAANKWRFGPGIARGDRGAVVAFRRSVITEWMLIVVVIAITATMTAMFTPEH